MFAVIATFAFLASGDHGVAASHESFTTLAACERARPALAQAFKAMIERQHGKVTMQSRCARVPDPDSSPSPPTFEGERINV